MFKLSLGIVLLTIMSAQESESDAVQIIATPTKHGAVQLSVFSPRNSHLNLAAVVRDSLHCVAASNDHKNRFLITSCPLLHSDRGMVDDNLDLAPLVLALHKGGASRIVVLAYLPSRSQAIPNGWHSRSAKSSYSSLEFDSQAADELPPPIHIRLGHRIESAELLVPLVLTLFVPPLLLLCLRSRRTKAPLLLNWISLGSWLYWISAVNPEGVVTYFAGLLHLNAWLVLALGAALYSVPPIVAELGSLAVLSPSLFPGSHSRAETLRFMLRSAGGSAAWTVGLGVFLVGVTLREYDSTVATLSILLAWGAYKVIDSLASKGKQSAVRSLDSGELLERTKKLAERAGVKLNQVYMIRNRVPSEANAFAFGNGRIGLTEGMLDSLTRREVDAVMAHELGHLRGRHVAAQSSMIWICSLVAVPLMSYLMHRAGMPAWFRSLPIAALLATFVAACLSRRHELTADAKAAELTGDPEAMIAALARLSRLSRSPLDWGGMQGAILSHPSMRKRVLAIADRAGVSHERALALLENPDLIGDHIYEPRSSSHQAPDAVRYMLPPELAKGDPLFNTAAKTSFLRRSFWLWKASVIAGLFGWALTATLLFGRDGRLTARIFLAGIPILFLLTESLSVLTRRWFLNSLEGRLRKRLNCSGAFMGLIPGDRIGSVEAFQEWDLGFLTLTPNALIFIGERAQFSISRAEIRMPEMAIGPLRWIRARRVLVRWSGGALSLQRPGIAPFSAPAKKLHRELAQWFEGSTFANTNSEGEALLGPPCLPEVQCDGVSKVRLCVVGLKSMFGMFLVAVLLASVLLGAVSLYSPLILIVPFCVPLFVMLDILPALLAPQRKAKRAEVVSAAA